MADIDIPRQRSGAKIVKDDIAELEDAVSKCLNANGYKLYELLGYGDFGRIWSVCEWSDDKKTDCSSWVVKFGYGKNNLNLTVEYRWITALQTLRLHRTPIVPRSRGKINCPQGTVLILERFQFNLLQLGFKQGNKALLDNFGKAIEEKLFNQYFVLFYQQLLRMTDICQLLGENKIVHGDIKPDNFLWKEIDNEQMIVINDFGIIGLSTDRFVTLGWMFHFAKKEMKDMSDLKIKEYEPMRCPLELSNFVRPNDVDEKTFAKTLNLMQLEASLIGFPERPLWVVEKGSTNGFYVFSGFGSSILDRKIANRICLNYAAWANYAIEKFIKTYGANRVKQFPS
jgi:hypothetical protein